LQDRLNQIKEKYGKWIVSASSNNIIVSPNNKLTVTDFNHAKFAPQQLSLFYLIDSYLPMKKY